MCMLFLNSSRWLLLASYSPDAWGQQMIICVPWLMLERRHTVSWMGCMKKMMQMVLGIEKWQEPGIDSMWACNAAKADMIRAATRPSWLSYPLADIYRWGCVVAMMVLLILFASIRPHHIGHNLVDAAISTVHLYFGDRSVWSVHRCQHAVHVPKFQLRCRFCSFLQVLIQSYLYCCRDASTAAVSKLAARKLINMQTVSSNLD